MSTYPQIKLNDQSVSLEVAFDWCIDILIINVDIIVRNILVLTLTSFLRVILLTAAKISFCKFLLSFNLNIPHFNIINN